MNDKIVIKPHLSGDIIFILLRDWFDLRLMTREIYTYNSPTPQQDKCDAPSSSDNNVTHII